MTRAFLGIGLRGAAAAAALCAPAFAQDGPSLKLSTGHVIVMTPAERLDCDALAGKLDEIDATGYRGRRPTPRHASDAPMLSYENEVSTRYYSTCMRRRETGLFTEGPVPADREAGGDGGGAGPWGAPAWSGTAAGTRRADQ